jgi:CPA1 family monovalent cation:H+ antiporter
MRGVVSLAAALSIPLHLSDGTAFPQRNLILFMTFIVILTTLLVQGLTLPYLIRKVGLPDFQDYLPDEEAEKIIQRGLAQHAVSHLRSTYSKQLDDHAALKTWLSKWEEKTNGEIDPEIRAENKAIYRDILNQQRKWLLKANTADKKFDEAVIRKHLLRIDIEEEKLKYL